MDISHPRLPTVMLPLISADDLASLFQTVSLSDELCFSRLPSSDETIAADEMTCSDSSLLVDSGNLVIKALNLMRVKTNIKQYFRVHLDKIVPMQGKLHCNDATDCVISYSYSVLLSGAAGLGGGSGNAATAMHAFNRLCGYPCSATQLREWSAEIGSDISFFFSSGTAYCTGRGEVVRPLPALPQSEDVVVHIFKPRYHQSMSLSYLYPLATPNDLHLPLPGW